jgi:WD40 repeat protein
MQVLISHLIDMKKSQLLIILLYALFCSVTVSATEFSSPLIPDGEPFENLDTLFANMMPRRPVLAVAVNPDGTLLAFGCDNNTVYLWDIASGTELKRFSGMSDQSINSLAFSPDGELLAAGSGDQSIYVWRIASGNRIKQLKKHTDDVMAIAFNPSGNHLASAAVDGSVYLWDLRMNEVILVLPGHSASINTVAFSPDGQYLATGSSDTTVWLWDISTGQRIVQLIGHSDSVSAVKFSPDGQSLASASWDKTVRVWALPSGQQLQRLSDHSDQINSIAFSPDGHTLAFGAMDMTIGLWDLQLQQQIATLSGHSGNVTAVVFSPNGKYLVSGSWDKTVRLWDVQTGQTIRRIEGHSSAVNVMALSPDGQSLLSGSDDYGVTMFQWPQTARLLSKRILDDKYRPIKTLAISPNGDRLAVVTAARIIYLLDRQTGQEITRLQEQTEDINHIAISPNGELLAVGSRYPNEPDSKLTPLGLWEIQSGNRLKRLKGHSNHLNKVAFSPDGKTLASASDDNTIRLWDITSLKPIKQLNGHDHFVVAIAFSPDGQLLASGSWDNTVRLWNVQTGDEVKRLAEHTNDVTAVAISPNGKRVASGSRDNTIHLSDTDSGQLIHRLEGHSAVVNTVTFSADSQTVISASLDASIRFWDVQTGELQQVLIGSRGQLYVSCDIPTQRCWRVDDGSLLVNKQLNGRIQPLPPNHGATGEMVVQLETPIPLEVAFGEASPFSLTIHNNSPVPIYWLKVVATDIEKTPLIFYPPNTVLVLAPNQTVTLPAKVSAWAEYQMSQAPKKQNSLLNLSITSANAKPKSVKLSVQTIFPQLTLQKAVLAQEQDKTALLLTITHDGQQALSSIEFIASIHKSLLADKVTRETIAAFQMVDLSFSLPNDFPIDQLDENTLISLRAIQRQHPVHQWDLTQTLELPAPLWYSYLLLGVLLIAVLISLYYLRLYLHPLVQSLSADNAQFVRLPLQQLPKAKRLLQRTGRLDAVLSSNQSNIKWLNEAIGFLNMSNQQRGQLLKKRLGVTIDNVFELKFGSTFPLKQTEYRLDFPATDLPAAEIIMGLRHSDIPSVVTVVISLEPKQQAELRPYGHERSTRWVVPDSRELTTLLLSPEPIAVFIDWLANQLTFTNLSPYQTSGTITKDSAFFGREEILTQILNREPMNYLVIGGRQIGKSSLLKKIERRYQNHPRIFCDYISLGKQSRQILDQKLVELLSNERHPFLLIDEADDFICREIADGYPTLSHFRNLSEEGRCHFMLAGFWELHRAATRDYFSPVKNFGEAVTIGALEQQACRQLATKPMAMLNIHYADSGLVEKILTATGQRANLVATICDKILNNLADDRRQLNAKDIANALHSHVVIDALQGWDRLSTDQQAASFDRILIYLTVKKQTFQLSDLVEQLDEYELAYRTEQLTQSLARLELAFIIQREDDDYRYCIPLFQEWLGKQQTDVLLKRELKEFNQY